MTPPDYAELLRWLYGIGWRGMKLGLHRMEQALRLRGRAPAELPAVHVAGTNGKGSVAAMVERAAREAGLRTGLFTSPHLHRFAERIRLDGQPVDEARLGARLAELRRWMAEEPEAPRLTFFETATLAALEIFAEAKVQLAVVEVGLGGRHDATNVLRAPLASAIVSVGLDHTHLLGHSLRAIAAEKAGIAKAGVPLVLGPMAEEARAEARRLAEATGARCWSLGEEVLVRQGPDGTLSVQVPGGERLEGLRPPLPGAHQRDNLAVAAALLLALRAAGLPIDPEAARRGLEAARWPGRLERVGRVLLDVAHNPAAAEALAEHLEAAVPPPRLLLFGAMADKDHAAMLRRLAPLHEALWLAAPRGIARAAAPAELLGSVPEALRERARLAPSVTEGLRQARARAGAEGTVVVAGSLFVVAEARAELLEVAADPPIAL